MSRTVLVLALALTLSACATGAVYGPDPRSTPEPGGAPDAGGEGARLPDAARPGEAARPAPGANATAALVAQSRAERDTGNLGGAAATVERALAIAPDDAGLWMELAEIRMEQGDWEQAEEMARKALTLTAESSEVAVRARRLLAQ